MKTVKLSTLIAAVAITAVIAAGAFTYTFLAKKPPTVVANVKTAITTTVRPAKPPTFLTIIRGKTKETEMNGPLSVAVGGNGRIYVADTGNSRIQVYDPNGEFIFQFGRTEEEPVLEMPATVVWHKGLLYVGDVQKNAILIFDESGKLQRSITAKELGDHLIPLAIAFEGETMYVASGPGSIYVIDRDGKRTATIGKPGGPEGFLGYPNGLAILDGKVVVADSNNQRIQVFDKSGTLLSVKTDLGLSLPRGMVVDRFGGLLVVDTFAHNVTALDNSLKVLFRFGDRGLDDGQFNFPNQLATDGTGRLYIADRENNRISVFGY